MSTFPRQPSPQGSVGPTHQTGQNSSTQSLEPTAAGRQGWRAGLAGALCTGLLLSSLGLPAQAAQPAQHAKARLRDARWLAQSSTWDSATPEHACVVSALQTGYALVAFVDAQSTDDAIEKGLTTHAGGPELQHLRQGEMGVWRRGHDSAEVSALELQGCLIIARLPLADAVPDTLVGSCLKQTEPAALLTTYRLGGKALPEAVKATAMRYPPALPGDTQSLAQKVYAQPSGSDGLHLREEIFDSCLQATVTQSPRSHLK